MPRKTQKRKTQKRRTQKRRIQKRRLQLGGKFNKEQNKKLNAQLKSFGFLSNKERKDAMKKLGDVAQQFSSKIDFNTLQEQLNYYYIRKDADGIKDDFKEWIDQFDIGFAQLVETDYDTDDTDDDNNEENN